MEPFMPHSCSLESFTNGRQIVVKGFIDKPPPERFSINLCCDPKFGGNVALHFNPRFDQNKVVFNTMTKDEWGDEEIVEKMPFKAGHKFEVIIQATQFGSYQIIVNGDSFKTYQARQPMQDVHYLWINGDCMRLYEVTQCDTCPQR